MIFLLIKSVDNFLRYSNFCKLAATYCCLTLSSDVNGLTGLILIRFGNPDLLTGLILIRFGNPDLLTFNTAVVGAKMRGILHMGY